MCVCTIFERSREHCRKYSAIIVFCRDKDVTLPGNFVMIDIQEKDDWDRV